VTVANSPVALSAGDLAHMFEPFWRADASHGDRTHVGLGLTVVQRVAEASGLAVSPMIRDGTLTIRLIEVTSAG